MTMPIILIVLSIICFSLLRSKNYYKSSGYLEMNFGCKALLVLFYICYLGVTVTSFGSSGSDAHALMIYPLIGAILFGVGFVLIFKIEGKSLQYKLIYSALILSGSLSRFSMYVLAALLPVLMGNQSQAKKTSHKASYDFDSEAAQQREQYTKTQAQANAEQAETNARAQGFHSAQEAERFGANR